MASQSGKIQQEFTVMVWNAKKLVAEKTVLSSPNIKPDKVLPPTTAEMGSIL
jgi:hypothetical protein